jgi:CarD family transcriptional regulator
MKTAFSTGDLVRYAPNGICRIKEIMKKKFPGSDKEVEYYVLVPVKGVAGVIYVPTESEALTARMRPLLNKSELDCLIRSSEDCQVKWIEDRRERGAYFHDIINRCDARELLKLIRCVYLKKCQLLERGKKLSSTDETILRQAESLVQKDFAFILEIPESQVGNYIRSLLAIDESSNDQTK